MKQNEHIATVRSPEAMSAAMSSLPATFARVLGNEIVQATYGWGCNLHIELCYIPVRVGTTWLERFIRESIEQRIVVPGDSDFIFTARNGELEIEFCHEGHIHVSGTNTSLIASILAEPAFAAAMPILSSKVRPNPSLKLTRYGRRCKPGPRHMVHHREPGLQHLPTRSA